MAEGETGGEEGERGGEGDMEEIKCDANGRQGSGIQNIDGTLIPTADMTKIK